MNPYEVLITKDVYDEDNFEVRNISLGFYISNRQDNYLWKDGQIHYGKEYSDSKINLQGSNGLGYWETQEEAQKFLDNYLQKQKGKNMSKKMFDVCGRSVSESTMVKALKAYCGFDDFDESKAPVFSIIDDRLIVKMTDKVQKTLKEALQFVNRNEYFSIEPNGFYGAYHLGETWNEAKNFYSAYQVKSLFPDEYPDPVL